MKTTKQEFNLFKATFTKWRRRLGLHDWRAVVRLEEIGDANARIIADSLSRIVTIQFSTVLEEHADIKRIGRHEALELLLADFESVARSRYIQLNDVEIVRHAAIRRLETLLDEIEVNNCV